MISKPKPHWVLCEGEDDKRVMQALAGHIGVADRLHFEDYAQTGFHAYLKTLGTRPEYTSGAISSVLVTKDADDSYASAWQSVSDAVAKIFPVVLPRPAEWVPMNNGPRFAAWIVPGPDRTGMIETLCLEAAREANRGIFDCLDSFAGCIGTAQGSQLHEKARFHLWTIVAQRPGAQDRLSLRRALEKMPPNWDAASFADLRQVLRSAAGES